VQVFLNKLPAEHRTSSFVRQFKTLLKKYNYTLTMDLGLTIPEFNYDTFSSSPESPGDLDHIRRLTPDTELNDCLFCLTDCYYETWINWNPPI